jgi:predicted nucleic-acid-binding protein
LVWVLEAGHGFTRAEIATALERTLSAAQFEIEAKDLAFAALDDFESSTADYSDCLIGRRHRAAGAEDTVTFDRSLKGLPSFRLL